MRIAILGHGRVGGALATHLSRLGEQVVIGLDPQRRDTSGPLRERVPGLAVEPALTAVGGADLVVLAVPFRAVGEVLAPLRDALVGRTLVDATNPVGPGFTHALGSERSATDVIASLAPGAQVVKAFSIYGAENFAEPPARAGDLRPAMLIAGDDDAAKHSVAGLIDRMGWRPVDSGPAAQALHLEHLTLLWLRMVRGGDRPATLTWAVLGD
ncbi:NADPH-dependent F420 reductase [Agromyces aurantiacus]|uniref:NADPH-dependent F420 reductase n=1 Tax=Agromyces aurantiacus TaxID=165814 RepID=A0ABV9R4M2_9MICO|nr:NADPH-dependent F420 reductase [Agromyces aurantiacus]MBM7502962.1 putative dinucleotide-binding enzyme [Agromyces aurantiacus]